jgi:DNA-binding CsgD family transcriptional regulator
MRLENRHSLTPREKQILKLIVAGVRGKQIALVLGISFKTVVTHRTHIMSKLECHTVAELVRYSLGHSLIQPPAAEESVMYERLREAHREYIDASKAALAAVRSVSEMDADNSDNRESIRLHHRAEHFAYEKYASTLREFSEIVLRNGKEA